MLDAADLRPLRLVVSHLNCRNMTAQNLDGTPSTLGNMSALGVRRLLVSCRDNVCGRETLVGCLALSGRHGDSGIGAQAGLRQMRP